MKQIILLLLTLLPIGIYGQDCDCESNYKWLRRTFEENDAGFDHALKDKGVRAYEYNNTRILEKVKLAGNLEECRDILYEWLTFFRSGHVSLNIIEDSRENKSTENSTESFPDWEKYTIATEDFKKYLDEKETIDFEGIWETGPYTIGIRQEGDEHIGFIIESKTASWTKGQVKLKLTAKGDEAKSVFYMRDHSASESSRVNLIGNNLLQIGNFKLFRVYPAVDDEPKYKLYHDFLKVRSPYLERLNETTLYFRIPSFHHSQKKHIDSVIASNRNLILKTENLIIDIRNGTGGSDSSYKEILPFIYTNPMRTLGLEYLSTELNNQRMLDFINKPDYGFDEEGKKWARVSFEKLEKKRGEFLNLDSIDVGIFRLDTIYSYPKNVGIIINHRNGSTDEQFLLKAKQSKKVKLFGTTTYGVLDISNMYYIPSPCNQFELGYCLTRSLRIPGMEIDGTGLQPDFYMDKGILEHEWVEFVNEILEEP